MNRFDRIFATALAGAALTLCVAANSIAANAESAPSAATVAYSYTLEGTVIETQDDLTLVEDLAGNVWAMVNVDLPIGQKITMFMDDNGTSDIYDDQIVKIEYEEGTV